MKKLMAALVFASFVALSAPSTLVAAQNQATLIFYNNTSHPLSLVVDKEHGHRCRVVVKFGHCSTYVTAGKHTVQAKYDDGKIAAVHTFTVGVDKTYKWTVYEEEE